MLVTRTKKLYPSAFLEEIEETTGKQFVEDFRKTYYWNKISDALMESNFRIEEDLKEKAKLRITFIPFLICILILYIVALFKYVFTGTFYFNGENFVIRKMVAWDKYCRFNIVR